MLVVFFYFTIEKKLTEKTASTRLFNCLAYKYLIALHIEKNKYF